MQLAGNLKPEWRKIMQNKYVSGNFVYKTDIGKVRMTNEDRALAVTNARGNVLMVVCDGMGGSQKGEYAATIATNCLKDEFLKKKRFINSLDAKSWMRYAVRRTNDIIYHESQSNPNYANMGTTLTVCLILPKIILFGQIGDSRAYLVRNKMLNLMTEDQTLVQYLYRTGHITKEEMKIHPKRHVLMNALGTSPLVELELTTYTDDFETILLCSDGLYNNVKESDINNILRGNDNIEQKCNQLIALANANGGTDNIAVVLWEGSK